MLSGAECYDFRMFEVEERKPQLKIVKRTYTRKEKVILHLVHYVFPAALVLSIFILILATLYCSAKSYELDVAINQVTKEIAEAKSRNATLIAQRAQKYSARAVDAYAEDVLNMVKVNNYQINYINLTEETSVVETGVSFAESVKNWFISLFY